MKLSFIRFLIVPLVLLAAIFSACSSKSTPPGADMAAGQIEHGGYAFLRWPEGLRLMIWHNGSKASNCHGSGSTTDPVYSVECFAQFDDERRVEWQLQTVDGKKAQFWIDEAGYDLSQGTLFIITAKIKETEVIQLQRDLSSVQPDHNSIMTFAGNDPDIAGFINTLANARTGIEAVDAIIEAILANDVEARRALVHYTTSACTTADGLGGPPKCRPGEADGTLVKAFPVLEAEGHHIRPESIEAALGFVVDDLYAVYRIPADAYEAEYWPAGEYGLVFTRGAMDHPVTITVRVKNGRMVRLDYHMGKSPAAVIEQQAGELLWPPVAPATSVSQDEVTPAGPMKGYEMYSWQIRSDWYFALLAGTNRLKSYAEISSPEVRIRGLAALKSKLAQLPAGEQIFWSAQRVPNTVLPPQEIVDQIRAYCQQYGLQLSVVAGN